MLKVSRLRSQTRKPKMPYVTDLILTFKTKIFFFMFYDTCNNPSIVFAQIKSIKNTNTIKQCLHSLENKSPWPAFGIQ